MLSGLQQFADRPQQSAHIQRFLENHTKARAIAGYELVCPAADHNDRDARVRLVELLANLPPVFIWQVEIEYQEVERFTRRNSQSLAACPGGAN